MQICIFFQIKSWSTLSLDVDLSFFNIVDFETKKGSWIVVFVMFVIFSTYSINLFYEWNPLFKKSFSFFYTYKNRSNFLFIYHKTDLIFYKSKPIFFSVLKKQIWYIFKSKDFVFFNKHRSEFFSSKSQFFSSSQKQIWFF